MTAIEAPRFTLREWSRMVRGNLRDKSYQSTRLGADVTDYLAWKRKSRASERTLDQYERDLRLVCFAVSCGAAGVTHGDLILVLDHVPEGSWKRVRSAWNDFFRWGIREGIRPDNPVDRLPPLRPTPVPVYDVWAQDELDLLVAGTRRMEHPLRERVRVLTMIESGGRAAELRGINLGDFDLFRKTVTVLGKGRKQRLIPISADLSRALDEYLLTDYPTLGRQPALTDFIWYPVWRRGEQVLAVKPERSLSYRGFYEWWRRVEAAAGVRHRKPHMTRHTFATDLLDATDGDIYAVRDLLGHSSVKVTETYLHSTRKRSAAAIDALTTYRKSNRQTDEP